MKIAFVHDYLVQYGGAERVLEAFCEIWPDAPIYTLLHNPKLIRNRFNGKTVRTSYLQKVPFSRKYHRIFPPLMLTAIEQFDLSYYDLVLSDSSSFAKNVITNSDTLHLCYCHTPMRYSWDDCQYYTQEFNFPRLIKKITPFLINYLRVSDFFSSNGVDKFIANSRFVSKRISKYYKRDSTVINPPVNIDNFYISSEKDRGDYFLMVGRMMKYKKMDMVIRVFNKMKLPLKIVGRGVEYDNLKRIAGPTIEFTGRVTDGELAEIYSRSQAFIFPQEEDFGIVAIEALASGRPVIAFRAGDIPENIEHGKTGILFDNQTEAELMEAIEEFKKTDFDAEYIRKTALKFDIKKFKSKIKKFVETEYAKFLQLKQKNEIIKKC